MKTAAIIGATGLVGRQLLRLLLESDHYRTVHSIGRRRVENNDSRLVQHVGSLDGLTGIQLDSGIDDVFCALGTTIKVAGTQENFARVDRDYVCEFAKWAKQHGAVTMAVNSSLGADPHSGNFYLRTKGEMENCLQGIGFNSLTIVRPSLLVPAGREPKRPAEIIGYRAMQLFGWLLIGKAQRYRPVEPLGVARAMLSGVLNGGPGTTIVESEAIDRFG